MATRADIMQYAGIKPCELPEGDFVGAVPAMPEPDQDTPLDADEESADGRAFS